MKKSKCVGLITGALKKNTGRLILIMLLIASSLLGVVTPIAYQRIIDDIIPIKDIARLFFYLAVLVITPWLITLCTSLKNYISAAVGDSVTSLLRGECLKSCLASEYGSWNGESTGEAVYVMMREIGKIGEVYITGDAITFVNEIFSLCAAAAAMFGYNVELSCICVVSFPLLLAMSGYVSKKAKSVDKKLMESLNEGQEFLYRVLKNIRQIKLSNGYEYEAAHWGSWLAGYRAIRLKSAVSHNINRFLMGDLVTGLLYGVVFFVGSVQVIHGTMRLGALVAFMAFVPKVYASLKNVMNIRVSTSVIKNSADKVDEILSLEKEPQGGAALSEKIRSLKFENVGFTYPDDGFKTEDISFEAKSGMKIGFVGVSGSGKSTIFDLITRLYASDCGQITINGTDIRNLDLGSVRSKIAVVSQDNNLFNPTVKSNILYPGMKCGEDTLKEIVHILRLDELAERKGYDGEVGEDGKNISGGEKQRIQLANALLKDADVILLDEFTSALDVRTERVINDYIFGLRDKIVIIITHRTYMIDALDYVYCVSEGKITEKGDPKELLNDKESYLYKLNTNIKY